MPRQKTLLGKKFGAILKRIRQDAGLTQEDLEELTGYSRVQIAYFETGISTPTLQSLLILEMALKLEPGHLSRLTMRKLPAGWHKKMMKKKRGSGLNAPSPSRRRRPSAA